MKTVSLSEVSRIPNYLFCSCSIGVSDIESSLVDVLFIFRSVLSDARS